MAGGRTWQRIRLGHSTRLWTGVTGARFSGPWRKGHRKKLRCMHSRSSTVFRVTERGCVFVFDVTAATDASKQVTTTFTLSICSLNYLHQSQNILRSHLNSNKLHSRYHHGRPCSP
jgi:hypothetical protein